MSVQLRNMGTLACKHICLYLIFNTKYEHCFTRVRDDIDQVTRKCSKVNKNKNISKNLQSATVASSTHIVVYLDTNVEVTRISEQDNQSFPISVDWTSDRGDFWA